MGSFSRFIAWAGAGLLLAGLFVTLLMLLTRGARAPVHPVPHASAPATTVSPEVAPAETSSAVPEDIAPDLVATADELQSQYETRKGDLPEGLAQPLDEEIGVIEGAVANLLAAIAAEPENDSLKRMLVATYRNEVRLLKKALHLSGDTDVEEELAEE